MNSMSCLPPSTFHLHIIAPSAPTARVLSSTLHPFPPLISYASFTPLLCLLSLTPPHTAPITPIHPFISLIPSIPSSFYPDSLNPSTPRPLHNLPSQDEFRSTYGKSRQWGLCDLLGHVVAFCQDQHGSRFIQQRLEVRATPDRLPCRVNHCLKHFFLYILHFFLLILFVDDHSSC